MFAIKLYFLNENRHESQYPIHVIAIQALYILSGYKLRFPIIFSLFTFVFYSVHSSDTDLSREQTKLSRQVEKNIFHLKYITFDESLIPLRRFNFFHLFAQWVRNGIV